MNFHDLSIRAKVALALLAVFILVLVASIAVVAKNERDLVEHVIEQQTRDTADSYFDSFNILMLTGTMAQRTELRAKILERPNVLDARLIRGKGVSDVYGAGLPEEQPTDEIDHQGLAGEKVLRIEETNKGRVLTVVEPIRASENYRGTNCLLCHQVPANTVLGAVRISYSLSSLDAQVNSDLLASGGVQFALFALGIGLLFTTLRFAVIAPLNRLRETMESIEKDSDLSRQIDIATKDEIGRTALAFNKMVARFRDSIEHVTGVTRQLSTMADRVSAVSHETVQAVMQQQSQTDQVATAMNEMTATVLEVAKHATNTAQSSHSANEEAKQGALVSTEALTGIEMLMREVERAAKVIHDLDEKSTSINKVLEVIRGIAEQTNLLALNAAIEAARAGEQGRGFAVVADEVRTLATRSHGSTEEIRALLEQLHDGVRDAVQAMAAAQSRAKTGAERVEKSAEALGAIASGVATINDMNTQIATAAEEQSAVAEEINRNVSTISQLADQTSEGAKQTSQVSEELVRLSNQLAQMVGRFRI